MPPFADIKQSIREFMGGFQHSQKMDLAILANDAPPLEHKSMFGTNLSGYGRSWNWMNQNGPSWSGRAVNEQTAQNLSTVYACRRIICETYGGLPMQFIQRDAKGAITLRDDLPIAKFFEDGNDERCDFGFRETETSHLLFSGNAYAHVVRRSSKSGRAQTAVDLEFLLPEQVRATRETSGERRLKYEVSVPGNSMQTFFVDTGKPQDILHIRGAGPTGLVGQSILTLAGQSLGTSLAMEENWGRFLARGGRVPYVVKRAQPFINDQAYEEWRVKWNAAYSDPHNPVLIEGNMEYQQIGISSKDAQLLESRAFSVPEICRWFGVSPSLVFDLSKANYNSLEQLIRSFINFTLAGWMKRWAGDVRRCVLTPEEKAAGIRIRHSTNQIEKGDFQARMSAYSSALGCGIFSINQVLEKEGEEPVPGLDGHNIQMQYQSAQTAGSGTPQSPSAIELEEEDAGA